MKILTSLCFAILPLTVSSAPALNPSSDSKDIRLNTMFAVKDSLVIPRSARMIQGIKINRIEAGKRLPVQAIEDLYKHVHIYTGAEALSFVRLRTILDLPSKADKFRGSEIISPNQWTRQIGYGVPWIFQKATLGKPDPSFGNMPDIWFRKNRLFSPIVKGLGYKWSVKRLVIQILPDDSVQPRILEEYVDWRGSYHANLKPFKVDPPPKGWRE